MPPDADPKTPRTASDYHELECLTIDNGDELDECVIAPADDATAPPGAWICALEGSFLDLESAR